ncbi:MAG TPA: tyrosine-type recombinase/integrase [Polyangiaceae bacterium]|nr:tyrosine-type recombinase/integrase [Polyangiaceae bacterium]
MAVRGKRLADGHTVYWITFQWKGKPFWIRSGTDEREARREDARIAKERKASTWRPDAMPPRTTNKEWIGRFLDQRTNRAAAGEKQLVTDHVLSQEQFAKLTVKETRPLDVERMVKAIRASGKLAEKTISNAFTVVNQAFKRAVFEEMRQDNPCASLPPGTIIRAKGKQRQPYSRAEVRQLMACEENPLPVRVWLALAFYTGMREGEICGRRWRDWSREGAPLSALLVSTQYQDQPLKTDDAEMARPRVVPVHPALAALLERWWAHGFELQFCRKPTPEDFIVPTAGLLPHSRSSAYRAFRRALARAKVANQSLHATRHTFITVCRAGTNRHDLVERITHNAKGTVLDQYTHTEWESLCEVIMGTDYSRDAVSPRVFFQGSDSRTRTPEIGQEAAGNHGKALPGWEPSEAEKAAGNAAKGVTPGAGQDPIGQSLWWLGAAS